MSSSVGAWLASQHATACRLDSVMGLLADHGIPATPLHVVASAAQAVETARQIGGRVVMKIDSPELIHKSDSGGVVLDIVSREDAVEAYERLHAHPGLRNREARLLMGQQLDRGIELYIGAKWDRTFGAIVVFGLGGRLVEVLGKTALAIAPLDRVAARDLIDRSGVATLLGGFRGAAAADLDVLGDTLMRVGALALAFGERLEALDLNPVIVNETRRGGCAVDARILLRKKA